MHNYCAVVYRFILGYKFKCHCAALQTALLCWKSAVQESADAGGVVCRVNTELNFSHAWACDSQVERKVLPFSGGLEGPDPEHVGAAQKAFNGISQSFGQTLL